MNSLDNYFALYPKGKLIERALGHPLRVITLTHAFKDTNVRFCIVSWVYRCFNLQKGVAKYTKTISSVFIRKIALIHSENREIWVDNLHICNKMTYSETAMPGGIKMDV